MSRRGRGAEPPPAPFVVGVGRSGTTLLRIMLDSHPELAIGPETQFVPDLIERARAGAGGAELVDEIVAARTWADFGLDPERLRGRVSELADPGAGAVLRTFYGLYAASRGKPRWGEKTPGYVAHMRSIAAELGEARFVHLIRDGRDVALSRRKRGMGVGKPIADAARLWRRRIEGARKQARRLRGRYLELRYEDLLSSPERELGRVCELVGLGFDPQMLEYHHGSGERLGELGDLEPAAGRRGRSGAERRRSHALAAQPPRTDRAGGWRERMSDADRREFEAEAGDLLAELGYDVAS